MQQKVIIDITGGTIVSEDTKKGIAPTKNGYLNASPGLMRRYLHSKTIEIAGYRCPYHVISNVDSNKIEDKEVNEVIGPTIARQANEGYDVIVYHGSDTVTFTAGKLSYNLYGLNKKIIITVALYDKSFIYSDIGANKKDSVIFAMKGKNYSGVSLVFGGNVLTHFLWGRHKLDMHNPINELLRLSNSKGIFENLEVELLNQPIVSLAELLHLPFEPIAKIKVDEIISPYSDGLKYDETTYLGMDSKFYYSFGEEGEVRNINFRGTASTTGKIPEINDVIKEYGRLRSIALNNPEKKDDAIADVEKLLKKLDLDPKIFTVYWKDSKIKFDPRTIVYEILVANPHSNPLGYIKPIEDGTYTGVVIRGPGFGHISMNGEWKKLLETAKDYLVPVSMVTKGGLITSNRYAIAKPIYAAKVNHLGTLNDDEGQLRTAVCVGHKDKRKFTEETAAEIFDVHPLEIESAFITSGMPFSNAKERNEWVGTHHYATNYDVADTPWWWEEKILLSALNVAYVSGKIPRS